MGRRRKRDTVDKVFLCISLFLVVAALAIAATVAMVAYRDINGIGGSEDVVKIEIARGSSAKKIANQLEEAKIISNGTLFRLYAAIKYTDPGFQYGKFKVSDNMTYEEIVAALQYGTVVPSFSITFPEGTTVLKMAMMLQDKNVEFTIDQFLAACDDVYEVDFYDKIVDSDLKFCKMDGWLFPDTYSFYEDATPHEIILKMLQNFKKKVLTTENLALIEANEYSLQDILTVASIVQKETTGEEVETQKIADVFLNRLKNSKEYPYLQTCASTMRLATGFCRGVLIYYYGSEAAVPAGMVAAYDAYTHKGLIEGPICNPGVLAIESVLKPYDGKEVYYFFCHDKNDNAYFASTYAEHQKNTVKAGLSASGSF